MQPHLEPGEWVQLESRPHGAALVAPLARALVVAVAGGVRVAIGVVRVWPVGIAGVAALAVAAALAALAVWRWQRTQLVLTTEKLVVVHGLARRRAASVRLAHAGAVEVEQGLAGRLLGYGTLVAGDVEVPYVPTAADDRSG